MIVICKSLIEMEENVMTQHKLSVYLKTIITGVGICGIIVYIWILPQCGESLHASFPEFAAWHWPWMFFLWVTAIPVGAALVLSWQIAAHIGEDRSFSSANARLLQIIAWLAAGDTFYFFIGNLVMLLLNMNHPAILLISMLICFAGVTVTIAAACLSHLARKAADLQEQSDLTV